MSVLVVGGAGYIGSHVCKTLASAGFQPVVFDNLTAGHPWAVRWGPLIEGDLADTKVLRSVIQEHAVEAVIHLAAYTSVGESVANPRKYFENNTVGTLALLGVMLDEGVKHIVFSSSAAVYGPPQSVPIPEAHVKNPISPYGDSKHFIERILGWYGQAYGLAHVSLRYFNACGADADGNIGEEHSPEGHLIPLVIHAALAKREAIDIFGTDYPTPDGTAVRDYIHVMDLADAHLLALQYLLGGGQSTALNLGTGRGHSVRQVIDAVQQVSGCPVSVREAPRRSGDPPELVADPSMAHQVLGWKPRHVELELIVKSAWDWHSSRHSQQGWREQRAGTGREST